MIPQIAHIKSQLKPKCRNYESVIAKGRNAEWMVDKFEEEDERIMREEREKGRIRLYQTSLGHLESPLKY